LIDLVFMISTILFPIIPAYLLFKLLDSKGTVDGKVLGFTVKLSGAFAGYFSVLLLIYFMYNVWHPTYVVYTVHGSLSGDGVNERFVPSTDLSLEPPGLDSFVDGSFNLKYWARRGEYPTLQIQHPGFKPITVLLNPLKLKDDGNGRLMLPQIKLEKEDRPYNPTAKLQQPTDLPPYPGQSEPARTASTGGHKQ
jgi:hypothetical protein